MVRSVGLSCKGACGKHPVRTTLSFNAVRENITTFRQSFSEGHSICCGVLCFLIISVHYRHFYCFGANRIKIAKSVQKNF